MTFDNCTSVATHSQQTVMAEETWLNFPVKTSLLCTVKLEGLLWVGKGIQG